MKNIATFPSTGAAINVALGCVPSHIRLSNLTSGAFLEWNVRQAAGAAAQAGGRAIYDNTGLKIALLTVATGIVPYLGGDLIASSSSANVIAAGDIVVAGNPPSTPYAGDMRSKGAQLISSYIVDSVANRTGHFDQAVDTTYVGVGSRVMIGGVLYTIQALSGDGTAANAVTLDRSPLASGPRGPTGLLVSKISFKYDFYNASVGTLMRAGITINETTNVNTGTGLLLLEYWAGETALG